MFSILTWCVYGLLVGAISKAIVPGEENFGFLKTIALGISGSYIGGALCYMIGQYSQVEPAGLFMGTVGSVIGLVVYNKVVKS